MLKVGLAQLSSSDLPEENRADTLIAIRQLAAQGAQFVLTPEATNCISLSRKHQEVHLQLESEDDTLRILCREAKALGIWLLIGSLLLRSDLPGEQPFVNRSFLIGPDGTILGRYDKIHMFDASINRGETYRESFAFRPGERSVLVETAFARIGMAICYDVRFPQLFRALGKAGADILTIPAAFTPPTGKAHWEALLKARAIECGAFVIAPAQTGTHRAIAGRTRQTYGHSMVISPWGEVLLDLGAESATEIIEIDLAEVAAARKRIPSLDHDRKFY